MFVGSRNRGGRRNGVQYCLRVLFLRYLNGCTGRCGSNFPQRTEDGLSVSRFVYRPLQLSQARGFLEEGDKKEVEGEVFAAPSKLAGESYQSLFDQVGRLLFASHLLTAKVEIFEDNVVTATSVLPVGGRDASLEQVPLLSFPHSSSVLYYTCFVLFRACFSLHFLRCSLFTTLAEKVFFC